MHTVFLRLESPLQAWGSDSLFVIRNTEDEPTKSGVVGLILACMGIKRDCAQHFLPYLNALQMGVRVDRPGIIISDYQTVRGPHDTADGGVRDKTEQTIRYYLSDASFSVALQGDSDTVDEVIKAVQNPHFSPYLGRKCCVPSRPIYEAEGDYRNLEDAFTDLRWRPRTCERRPNVLRCVADTKTPGTVKRDVLASLLPHRLESRLIKRFNVNPGDDGPPVYPVQVSQRSQVDYNSPAWKKRRYACLARSNGLCVLCGLPAADAHHITYKRANNELPEDLKALCKLCHKTISAIEYECDMDDTRLDPTRPDVRKLVLERRHEFKAAVAQEYRGG